MQVIPFGESHGPCVGVLVTGLPAGLAVNEASMLRLLARRAPGVQALTTARREADVPELLSGVYNGFTTGEPLCLLIRNTDARSSDYAPLANRPRPGHADFTAWVKSGGHADPRGGGHHSGRLTAPLTAAGAIALDALEKRGVHIRAQLLSAGGSSEAEQAVRAAAADGDSVGGVVRCTAAGLPAGLGSAERSVESVLSAYLFNIPAVKAVAFGAGKRLAAMRGSEANDAFCVENGRVVTSSNHCGGVLGGITDGMDVVFDVTFKPTPSIAVRQQTVDLASMQPVCIEIAGRHDPCVAIRAVPVVEAAAALAILTLWEEET